LKPVSVEGKWNFYAAGFVKIILGEVLYEWNNLEEAEMQIRQGIRDNEPWNNITLDVIGYMDLVSVQRAKGDLDGTLETMKKLETMLQGRTIPLDLEEELWTYKIRLWLAKGDLARAGEWADRMVINQPQDFLQEWGWITCARVRLAQGRYREAQVILETLARLPGSANRILRQIRAGLLLSIVLFYQNQLTAALQTLEACLDLTEPGNYLRVFLDSGKPMRELLSIYLQTPTPTHKAYAQKLLAAFHGLSGRSIVEKAQTDLVEPLTPRELEVLRLLAAGCSNRQIAETLVLAEGTVKFYVHAVLAKLEVHSRTQAIAKARELNLV
jgi:LuxR family transcriptional regulator, maltose regulon positive regulatory protein